MTLYQISDDKLKRLEPLFVGWNETMIWSVLQGEMGKAWADSSDNPRSALLYIADFCFFAGTPIGELVERAMEEAPGFTIMVPCDEPWSFMIKEVCGENAKPVVRYGLKKEPDVFDRGALERMSAAPDGYDIMMIDETVYKLAGEER